MIIFTEFETKSATDIYIIYSIFNMYFVRAYSTCVIFNLSDVYVEYACHEKVPVFCLLCSSCNKKNCICY